MKLKWVVLVSRGPLHCWRCSFKNLLEGTATTGSRRYFATTTSVLDQQKDRTTGSTTGRTSSLDITTIKNLHIALSTISKK
ncbi:unnamed protein product [Amoebophrya sp. A25]|nr:unnamed protein product [Amoebophrya sp. A25]|eukprot:GSA25T00012442001.1